MWTESTAVTATLTFNDDDNYLADVAKRLAALGELPSLPDPMPTWGEMVAWVARGRCPRDAKSEAERRCRALYGWTTLGQLSDFELGTNIPELVLEASVPLAMLKIEEADEENDGKDRRPWRNPKRMGLDSWCRRRATRLGSVPDRRRDAVQHHRTSPRGHSRPHCQE